MNPHFNDKLAYKLEDFDPVAPVATVPFAFVVKKDFPAKTVKEFAADAKANPAKVNNATNGQGSMVHLLGELIDKLGTALRRITTSASFAEAMHKIGNEAKSGSPADLRATTLEQARLWGDLIRRLNIKAE